MKKLLLLILLAPTLAFAGWSSSYYNPYIGGFGGYRFSDGSTATYNPYQGGFGGWRFNDGSTANYNPYQGGFGGWQYQTPPRYHWGH
jgi:hypothetical protein